MSGNLVSSAAARRSSCPVACVLELLGDRWTLLVVRDLVLGRSRFKEFEASPERIPTNILSERLERLLRHGIVEKIPVAAGARHFAYRLTEKGASLKPLLAAFRDWGLRWEPGAEAALKTTPIPRIGKKRGGLLPAENVES